MNQNPELLTIQEWAEQNEPAETMRFHSGYWNQILFIRDTIAQLVFGQKAYENRKNIQIISTHTSKSIKLPVYQIKVPHLDLTLVLRNNFHNWKISVISKTPIACDFMGLFDTQKAWPAIYCEGFGANYVYPAFAENNQTFTLELQSDYDIHLVIWLITRTVSMSQN